MDDTVEYKRLSDFNPWKALLGTLIVASIVIGIGIVVTYLSEKDSREYVCGSNNSQYWGTFELENKTNPVNYKFETCINKDSKKIVFNKRYGWNAVSSNDKFSKNCKNNKGIVYNNTFAKPIDYIRHGKGGETIYKYDHFYGCVKNGSIVNYYINSTADKKE